MEVTAGRGGALPAPSSSSHPPRKEWRAISDQDHMSVGERTIYEEGAEAVQQRLQEVSRQREELQHLEIELRAQAMARSELIDLQSRFRSQLKEHTDAASQLKEQLLDREQQIDELSMQLEEKERELHAIKIDNEAAWAKDDLLREQNKELAIFRRERDNAEAERAQHLKQIHDLQEHIQEKESQLLALEEQHRVAQKTILYRDEQLRDAQTWIARAQEVDAMHSTTNQSLQAEMRERAEQFAQYYFGLQRQFAEVERHHLQTIQQLQLELAEAREKNGTYKDGAHAAKENSMDPSPISQNKGDQINVNNGTSNGNLGFIANGNLDGHPSYVSSSNVLTKAEHAAGVAVVPTPVLGMGTFLPPGQMTALHPFVIHTQGVPQSISSSNQPIAQSQIGHFQPMPSVPTNQHWVNQQAVDASQTADQKNYQPSQAEQNPVRPDVPSNYELPAERKVVQTDLSTNYNQPPSSIPSINGSSEELQLLESKDKQQYQVSKAQQEKSHAPVHANAVNAVPEKNSETKDQNAISTIGEPKDHVLSGQLSASTAAASAALTQLLNASNVTETNGKVATASESSTRTPSSVVHMKKTESILLDERSLLACIVRAIPAGTGGRIRISTTLPNRLGKMLAPLHWHDYKTRYGKLDDFLQHHPELFVIEGDFIHLREGAQEIISATTAFAKVAAAAAAASPATYSSMFSTVALTPVAQSTRLRRVPSVDSRPANLVPSSENVAAAHPGDSFDKGNGANRGLSNGRFVSGGKQQARSTGAGVISRR